MPPKLKISGKITALFFLLATVIPAFGQAETNKIFSARAETEFLAAQKSFELNTNDAAAAWRFGHASFDWADCATNEARRAEIARTGIAACRQALAREPKSAAAHYYLAMNFGQLAQAEAPSMAAYKLVREIEREFKLAAELDEKFDFGGPPRCLGLLYRDAPGWPISIGSKHKAREWLDRAETLAPEFPENPLNLAETHLQWHQRAEAEKAFAQLDAVWPAAQTNLAGVAWEKSWQEWAARRAAAHAEFNRLYSAKKSPVK
jgi:hypothetical protein